MAFLYHTCTHLETIILSMHHGYTYLNSINQFKADMYLNTLIISNTMVTKQNTLYVQSLYNPSILEPKNKATIKLTVCPITSTLLFNTGCTASVDIFFNHAQKN